MNRHTFRFVIGMSFANAFFGMAHVALLPIFADRLLGSSTGSGLGLLFSAGGLGGFAGALIAGSVGNMRRKGWLIVGGSSGFGLCLMAFAVSPWYGLSAGLEWLGSLSNQLFMVTGQSTLHRLVPDDYRGRVMGIWGMTHSVAQPFGGFQMGGLASVFSAPIAVAAGGGIIALFAIAGAGRDSRIRNLGIEPGGDDQPVHPSRRHNLTHTWRC